MVRSLISVLVAALILSCGAIYEQLYVNRTFSDFESRLELIYDKTEQKTVTEDDVNALIDKWHDNKRELHVFLSHNDIKEFDLWLAETLSYVKQKNYGEAIDKIEVAIELVKQVPKGYRIKFENIF